jgi:hypothetical protein
MAGTMGRESRSRRFALDAADMRKLGTGFLVALVGALATFLSDLTTSIDFGLWSPFVGMAISVAVNFLRKWMTDNSAPPPAPAGSGFRRAGRTMEALVLVLAALTLGAVGLAYAIRGSASDSEPPRKGDEDQAAVTRAFVLQRQLFARVCLEAARRERSGEIASEEGENAWCEPRWAAARKEAFAVLAEARDRQLAGGWTPESSAAGLEAWAVAADPNVAAEVQSHD